jgi:GT2 family glycosyltransferase
MVGRLKLKPEIEVSVIIVNWNGRHHLEECLDSLGGQTFKHFETILVDNGSRDGSVSWVREKFPWVRVLALPENTGFCYANNLGYEISRGRFVVLLNNDTRVEPDWLFCLYERMKNDDRIGLCASRIVGYDNGHVLDAAGDGYDFCGVGFRRGHGENADLFEHCQEVFGACAAAGMYRKSVLEDIGFLDEGFFAVGEDIDLSFRARMAGYRCIYVSDAVVRHKISETIGVGSDFQIYQSRRNVEYVYFKNMPLMLIFLTLPMHLLYNLLTFAQALAEGRPRVFLKAKADFLMNFGDIYRKRRAIQVRRNVSLKELVSSFSKNYLLKRYRLEMVGRGFPTRKTARLSLSQ